MSAKAGRAEVAPAAPLFTSRIALIVASVVLFFIVTICFTGADAILVVGPLLSDWLILIAWIIAVLGIAVIVIGTLWLQGDGQPAPVSTGTPSPSVSITVPPVTVYDGGDDGGEEPVTPPVDPGPAPTTPPEPTEPPDPEPTETPAAVAG